MERVKNDYYATPSGIVDLLVKWQRERIATLARTRAWAVDPCAGDGAILRALPDDVLRGGFDIEPKGPGIAARDALAPEPWTVYGVVAPDATVTNPPFSAASAIIRRALSETPLWVAALLRLSFLEPCRDRRDLLELRPDVLVLPKRPRFRTDTKGTDSVTCAWFSWPGNGRWEVADAV